MTVLRARNRPVLTSENQQEPYRGRGIAKAIATKVMRDHSFGDDGWSEWSACLPWCRWQTETRADMLAGSADVHIDNVQSQGLCKSLGAKKGMRTCW